MVKLIKKTDNRKERFNFKMLIVKKMIPFLVILLVLILLSSCSRTVYIVRHAEKVATGDTTVKMNAADPPLSESGKVRAYVLRDELKGKNIKHIFSTGTLRTVSTAEPLVQSTGVNVE